MRYLILLALTMASAAQTALPQLFTEADGSNPRIVAAYEAWRAAAAQVAPAGAMPDPQAMLQPFSVGNPLPLAGYRSSNFAYIGLGVSQQIPYPGKLARQRAVARAQAEAARSRWQAVRRQIEGDLETAYDQLAYWQEDAGLLHEQQTALRAATALAEERYRTGAGTQAEVLAAQTEQTGLLRQMAEQAQMEASAQAQVRELLDRPPGAAPLAAPPLMETKLEGNDAQIQAALATANPNLAAGRAQVREAEAGVAVARRAAKPDFSAQYMFERTGPGFPDYYMLTLTTTLPWLHRGDRYRPAMEAAVAHAAEARAGYQADEQDERFRLTDLLLRAHRDEQILQIDTGGLMPQARAQYQAALSAYGSGHLDLSGVLAAWRRQLEVEQQYWQTLAEHESTLGQITTMTGVPHAR